LKGFVEKVYWLSNSPVDMATGLFVVIGKASPSRWKCKSSSGKLNLQISQGLTTMLENGRGLTGWSIRWCKNAANCEDASVTSVN
jgi:hypothetical protein